jgi:phosphoribosylformylglycinamidine synthase
VLRIKGTRRGIALTTDGNGRFVYLDPEAGGKIAVAEAARNIVCMGARPVAATNCLNFGNPEKPDIYYQLERATAGMAAACVALDTPIVSGNVSLYNESERGAVYPTPVVGMLGIFEDVTRHLRPGFQQPGDIVALLGGGEEDGLAGSEYQAIFHGAPAGQPVIDLDLECRLQQAMHVATEAGWLRSAHDCSLGGLAVALARCAIAHGLGLEARAYDLGPRLDAALFGETQSRIVISCAPEHWAQLEALAARYRLPLRRIGVVGGDRFQLGGVIDLPVAELAAAWHGGLPAALAGEPVAAQPA